MLDQWLCFWSVPFFFSLFGLVFVPLSWMIPPRSPSSPLPDIVDFMQSQNLLLACVILTLSFGLAPVSNACYLIQMRRMSVRSEEHTSELQSLMRISYAVFCLKKKKQTYTPRRILC